MSIINDVAERLVRFRVKAGLDPAAAAARAHVEQDRLDGAETGDVALTETEIAALAGAYAVDPTEIFGGRITPLQDYAGGA
ncbi:MAG TPA: helix-turn-helix domain-containing protein [Candidatus Elarobacter sp.]|nr:helix-turn-helix domain-containing protein [Dongiaceae bacterium]HZW53871.1 helix-turn-helix domain-containing protein [Candidatus Elarobacter sp.]